MSAAFPCRPARFLQLFFLVSILFLVPSNAAPVTEDLSQTEQGQISEYYGGETKKCYYNFQHYEEGDRIITNEPCLNCTCHKRMLMCYLRVCPFTKAIGQDCKVEKKPDQCCPVITCPEVPVQLLTSSTTEHPTTSSSNAVAHPDNHGCRLENNSFYPDGAQLPIAPNNPCELCYCIRNRTACVMQECTLNVEGCRPVYQDGVCCPVRYDCDYYDVSTTERPSTGGLQLTPTPVPLGCRYGNTMYNDGEKIQTDKPCESCYCMRGDIVCAVRSCGTPLQGKDCEPLPPPEGECCPTTYKCANGTVPIESLSQETATASTYTLHTDESTDHPEQQPAADNIVHDIPEHDEEVVEDHKVPTPSEPETESSTSITSDSEKPTDQTAETAQHEEQVQQLEEESLTPSYDEKPSEEPEKGHIEQIHGEESTGEPEEEDSHLSTSSPIISEHIPSDIVSGIVSIPHVSESAHTDIKIEDTLIPTAIPEYSGIEESIKNNTIQSIITDLLHPEEQKPINVNDLVTSSPETTVLQTGEKQGETENKPDISEDSEATTALPQEQIFHSPDDTPSSVPIESASSVLKPEDENIIKGQEPEKSEETAAVTSDQDEHLHKPASVESDSVPVHSEESATESEQTVHEHPVQTENDDSVIKADESSPNESPVVPDLATHIESEEGEIKPEEPLHVETTAHPGIPESDETVAVKPEEPSAETPAAPVEEHLVETSAAPAEEPSIETQTAEEPSVETQTAEEPSVETQTAEVSVDETKLEEHLHEETPVVPEHPPAVTEVVETGGKPEELPVETSLPPEHVENTESDEVANKPEEPSTIDHSVAPEQPVTEGLEEISTSEYSSSVSSSVETGQVHAESDQVAINPEESSSEIPQQPAQHESESTAQPEAQDATEKPEISETVESETIETKPEEHTTTSLPEQPATIESDHPEQFPEKTSHDETEHPPSSDSNEVASKPEEVVPFVGIPAIPELPSTIVADEVESNQEEHIETTSFPEQQAPIESETESTAIPEHPSSVSSDDLSVKPEETPSATEESSNIESGDGTVKPVELPEETPTLDITEQPIIAESDESAQKPEEPQIVHAETTDAIPQEPSAVESDDVAAKPEESSLKPHEDTATESVDIPETSEISKPQEVEESSRPESKPEENIIALDNEALEVSSDAHLHPTESSQGEGITESEQTIQPSKPEEEINRIPEDAVKPEDNKVEDSTEHETTVLHEHVQLPAVSDETESEHEITDATEKPAAEEVVPGKLDNTVDAVEEEHHTSSDIQHQTSATDSENAVATELSEGEKPVEAKPQDEGNAVENVTEIKPEAPESNVIHDSEQNAISETNTVVPVENEEPSESDGATTSKSDISESSVDESQKPDTTKESLESYNSEESSVPLESDTGNVESSTLYATVDESPVHSSESQEQPTIPEDAQEPEKNVSEGEDTNQIPEQSFDSQSTNQEDTTTDKDQTSISHVSEDIDKPEKTEVPIPAIYEEPPKPSESESDQGELQTHVESNTADVPIEGENKKPEKHDSETATPESDVSSKPEESTSIDILPEEVKPVETSDSSQHEPSIDSENQVNGEKPVAPEIIPPSSESVNELITGEVAPSPNEIPDTIIPVHGGAIDIESITQHLPGPTGILSPESEQGVIPGEGSCLVDDVTYSNNSKIPSSSQCHKECVCISSIVHCIGIDCPPPPPHLSNCMPIQQGPDSCCPMYACDGETPTLLESHSQIGDSDGSKQPVKGSDSVQQHETPESPEKPVEIQTVEPTHDESSITIHGDVVPDHVESDSASSQSVHKPETSEVIPEKPAETPEHPSLPALPIPENVEHDFIPEQPSEHEGTDITDDQIISEILPQEHTEIHDSVGEHEMPVEQQTSSPSDDTKGSDKVPETSEHVTESSTTDEKIPETPVTSSVHSVPSEETVTAIIVEEPISTDETAVESKPSEAPEDSLTPTESEVPASPEQPILDTSLDHEESKPVQGGGEAESPLQPQETPSNVLPSQDVVEASGSSEQPEQSAVTDSVIQHEIVLEDASTPIPLQEGQQQVTAVSGDIQPPLAVDKPSSVKFESADSELTRPEDSSEPVKSDQESSTIIEAVEPTQQSIVESEQPSVSHKDEVSEAPQEVTEDVHPSTDSSKLSEDVTTSVTKDEVPEHLVDSHASVTDANKIDTSGEAVHEDVTAAQKPEESETLVTQAPVDLDLSKLEETSPESVGQEATATQAHSEQPSVSHDATPEDADHAQSVSEEFTTSEGDALVTSGPLEDVQHLVTSSPFKPEEAPINADKPEQEVISEQMGKPSEQHAETEEGTPSTVGAQHNEEPVYEEVTTETNAHTEAEGEVPASLPGSTEGQSNLPEQDGTVQQQTEEQSHQPTPEKPAPVDSDVPEETTVQLEDHELVSPSKTDIPVESHIHDEIPKPSESITPDEAQKPQGETNKDKETEKPVDLSETPVHTEQAQVITSDEQASSVEHKPEEPTVTSPVEQIPEEPHVTGVDQTPPDVELKPEEPQITSDEHEPPKVDTESKPEEPQITSDEHEPPKVDTESKPEEPQITSGEHEPPKGDIELKPEEPQVTSDEHEPPKEDAELKPEEPQITSSEHEPPKVVELKPEEPQITSDEHEPPKSDVELKPEGPQITTDEQAPLKPEEPHITSGEQVPTKVDTESKPEEPQISSDEQTPTKVETELKPEEQHITGDEHVQAEVKPEEPHVTSDEQAPPKVDTELKPEEPQVTSDEQKPSVIDHEGPQVIGESGEPLGVKPEESHQPEEPHITSDTTSLEQKPEPHITTNIETQPEANIEQKPSSLVPSTHITQDILESQQHVTVAPDSVNELHSEHQTLTKPIEHIPGLYPEEESNYGPLQVPGWTPKPYQPSEHPDEINQHEEHFPSGGDMDYELEEDGPFGPGTCRYGGKIYVSAQQIPRDDPCDFCFCFRSDIICLQQSCPPPIHRCRQESIKGFCCPRYECPVSMATALNLTTTTTTTTTTLPPHFFAHAYKGAARRTGCQVRGKAYRVGEEIRSASGPCLQCICGADGQMKCEPKVCSPEPMLRKMMEEAISRRRR